jgi:hypothetical protein
LYGRDKRNRQNRRPWHSLIGFGNHDGGIALIEQAYDFRDRVMITLNVDPMWDPVRDDRRFQDILRRMNIPEN